MCGLVAVAGGRTVTKPMDVKRPLDEAQVEGTKGESAGRPVWEPPQILWEQAFRPLLQASPIIGLPCDPSRDANCS